MSGSKQEHQQEREQDMAVEETFPASDPPAKMGTEAGPRAVPADELMAAKHPAPFDAVTLRRRFSTTEAAKLALEGLVRDGPVDRHNAELKQIGKEIELSLKVPPEDCHRLRGLLAHAQA